MNVFEWAKTNGGYINPRVSTGMFPIPGKGNDLLSPPAIPLSKVAGAQEIGPAPRCADCGRRAQ